MQMTVQIERRGEATMLFPLPGARGSPTSPGSAPADTASAVARYHGARIGRFHRPDPVRGNFRNPQRLNRYAYVTNNPVRYVDPKGRDMVDAANAEGFWGGGAGDRNPDPVVNYNFGGGFQLGSLHYRTGDGGGGVGGTGYWYNDLQNSYMNWLNALGPQLGMGGNDEGGSGNLWDDGDDDDEWPGCWWTCTDKTQNVMNDCIADSLIVPWLCSGSTREQWDTAIAQCAAQMVAGGATGGGVGAATSLIRCATLKVGASFLCDLAMAPCASRAQTAFNTCMALCDRLGPVGPEIP